MVSTAMVASILMSYQSQEGRHRQQNNGWEYQHAKKEFDRDDDYETVMIRRKSCCWCCKDHNNQRDGMNTESCKHLD